MARKASRKAAKHRLEKVGISLTALTNYRSRILAAKLRITQSQLVEQLLVDRMRGEDLPALPRPSDEADREELRIA